MHYDFDAVLQIKDMNSVKWENMKSVDPRANEDTLAFWIADMDFACCSSILDGVRNRLDKSILGYSTFSTGNYLQSVQAWYQNRFGWTIDAESIFYSPGLVTALANLVNILTEKGDGVIIQRPAYPPFARVIEKNGRVVVNNPLIHTENGYAIDFEDFEAKCKDNKLFIFCSPHNPTGRVWTKEELTRLADICQRNDVLIVSDEIHCDLTRTDVTHYNLVNLSGDAAHQNRIITCTAPSKTFNIAGLAQSHVIINDPALRQRWTDYCAALGLCSPNPLALSAAKAAFDNGGEWVDELKRYLDDNMSFIEQFLSTKLPNVKFHKPQGTYLAWLDCSHYGTSDEVFGRLLEKGNVMVQRGTDFGNEEGEGFVRFNAACPRKILEEGLHRMCQAFSAQS